MVKKLIILFIAILLGIFIIFCIIHRNDGNSKLTSGGPYTHTYTCEGFIVDISDDREIITVKLNETDVENFSFASDHMHLDCSNANHLDDVNAGDTIKFSFFLWNVEDTNIKIHDVYLTDEGSR